LPYLVKEPPTIRIAIGGLFCSVLNYARGAADGGSEAMVPQQCFIEKYAPIPILKTLTNRSP
jgi:hypothetical protein